MKADTKYLSFCPQLHSMVLVFYLLSSIGNNGFSQLCGSGTPLFIVDLSNNPDATFISSDTVRDDTCCGATFPDRCVEFFVTLHPDAEGIVFNIYSGAIPPGALYYQISCSAPTLVGKPLCLSGAGPYNITFCKPGSNSNEYSITSIGKPKAGPGIAVNEGCSGKIFASGYDNATITWASVAPGAKGDYNSYLNCTSGCDTVLVNAQPGYPLYVDYEVCGIPAGGCGTIPACDTVRVYFNSTLTATIQPDIPTVCFGSAGTTITANGSGGTLPYYYLWNTGETTQSIFAGAGTYVVELGDTSGCPPTYDTITVTGFASTISANAGADLLVCVIPAFVSGSVTGTSSGQWSGEGGTFSPDNDSLNSSYSPSAAEINAGASTLILFTTGNGSCPADADTVVLTYSSFTAGVVLTTKEITCSGANDGAAWIDITDGNSIYTVNWNAPISQTSDTVTGLSPGNYSVTISDTLGCDSTIDFIINDPAIFSIVISDSSNVTCTGGSDGYAVVSAAGGIVPYTYLWDAASGFQTNDTAKNLPTGSYDVTVSDAYGCTLTIGVSIIEPASALAISFTSTPVSCKGGNDGTATASATGGIAPYTYQWGIEAGSQTDSAATGLVTGTYSVTVTDNTGKCKVDDGITVGEPATLLTLSVAVSDVRCFGGNDGAATANPAGGTGFYTYDWDPATGSQITQTATALSSGTYGVTVTDGLGACIIDTNVVVDQPTPSLGIAITVKDVGCKGGKNGSALVTATGGTAPYTYIWDPTTGSQTDSLATGLSAGTYAITVTDANACADTITTVQVNEPDSLSVSQAQENVTCNQGKDGSISLSAQGGISPYTYIWNPPVGIDTSATGLTAGSYQFTITDFQNCTVTNTSVITEPGAVVVSIVSVSEDTVCAGDASVITASGTGGNGGYTYTWNQGLGTGQVKTVNPANTTIYTVYITDNSGCLGNTDGVIVYVRDINNSGLTATASGDVCKDSSVTLSGSHIGDMPPYSYIWSNGLIGLGPHKVAVNITATYTLSATDKCGNSIYDSVMVQVLLPPVINLPALIAEGCEPLTVSFSEPSAGADANTYLWIFGDGFTSSEPEPNHTYSNSGSYVVSLTVSDTNGCASSSADHSVIVNPKPDPGCSADPQVTTTENPDISFSVNADSVYSWDFGDGESSSSKDIVHTYNEFGTYNVSVSVTNQYGCMETCQLQIIIYPKIKFETPNAFTPNPDGANGGVYDFSTYNNDVFFPITKYVTEFHMMIFNRWGELVFESFDVTKGWDGYYKGSLCQQDVYAYRIVAKFEDDTEIEKIGDLTLIR